MTAAAVPLLISAAGMGVSYLNERQADSRRKSILAAMTADQSKRGQRIAAKTLEEGKRYTAEERAPQQAAAEDLARDDYGKALTASENVSVGPARAGKLSNRFTTGSATAKAKQTQSSKILADLMAKVRAPGDLRTSESMRRAGVAESVGSDLNDARFAADAGGQDVANVRVNPFAQLLGQGLQAYGAYSGAQAASSAERLKTLKMMAGAPKAPVAGSPFNMPAKVY